MAKACIPTKLTVFLRPATTYTRRDTTEELTVCPAFVIDADSTMEGTARSWAAGHSRWISPKTELEYRELTDLANTPITRLRLVGISKRSEGGLAYKVVYGEDNWLVDFREEEFLAALFQGRIDPKGYITGDYVWSRYQNQMRIVEVGSKLYNERLEAGGQAALVAGCKRLSVKALVPGNVYITSGTKAIYLGRVKVDFPTRHPPRWENESGNAVPYYAASARLVEYPDTTKTKKCFAWRYLESDRIYGKQPPDRIYVTESTNFLRDMGPADPQFEIPEHPKWVWWGVKGRNVRWVS